MFCVYDYVGMLWWRVIANPATKLNFFIIFVEHLRDRLEHALLLITHLTRLSRDTRVGEISMMSSPHCR